MLQELDHRQEYFMVENEKKNRILYILTETNCNKHYKKQNSPRRTKKSS